MCPKQSLGTRAPLRVQHRALALILLALLTLMSVLTLSAEQVAGTEGMVQQPSSLSSLSVNASELAIQGKALYEAGQFDAAARVWQQAADTYAQVGDKDRMSETLINKAEALQALGLEPKACNTLLQAFGIARPDCQKLTQENENRQEQQDFFLKTLEEQPISLTKVIGLRGLGDVLQKLGDFKLSQQVLRLSLKVAQELSSPQDISATLLSLGNTEQAEGNNVRSQQDTASKPKPTPLSCINKTSDGATRKYYQQAAKFYQQAAIESTSQITRIQAQLNHLSVLLDLQQESEAQDLWPSIQSQIKNLPASRTAVSAQINLAQSVICLRQANRVDTSSWRDIANALVTTVEQAKSLSDQRAESYALGYLGGMYQQSQKEPSSQDLSYAGEFTEQALGIAQSIQAWDIAYLWQWQLGAILKSQKNTSGAIAAYEAAFNTLEYLRKDLVALSSNIQYSFAENVEPVYRQLVDLLLAQGKADPSPENIAKARNVIESLRVAELEIFLRCSLDDAKPVLIDQPTIEPTAAVIYPIILSDRIEVILSLPGNKPLSHYSNPLPKDQSIADILETLRTTLKEPNNTEPDASKESQQVYDLLLRKIESDLENNNIQTLVFVLDGALRNIPMAALHNGKQYLIEKYAVAISPSLQLLSPKPLARERLEALAAGFSKASLDFPALPNVREELERIKSLLSGIKLLDRDFTTHALKTNINSRPFPIVHLATHGKFGSQVEDTYILTGDGHRLNVNQLSSLLRTREQSRPEPIELLTLSACETAEGNKWAALGMAGVAIRSGARSTLATLWSVNDKSTTDIMSQFYELLVKNHKITKVKALQSAQVELLRKGKSPFHWSPYVLIGNWL